MPMGRKVEQPVPPLSTPPGLCGSCLHRRLTANNRGGSFLLCEAHNNDPRLPKYPLLPVLTCHGYQPSEFKIDEES